MANESNAAKDPQVWSPPNFDEHGEETGAPVPVASPQAEGADGFALLREVSPRVSAGAEFAGQEPHGEERDPDAPDFASIKFQRENTLLSNADKYAASIREEAELYVAQMRKEIDELNQEAEARYEEARQVKEAAEKEAEKMVADAQEQVDDILEQARLEGLETGEQEGMQRRYEEAGVYLERMQTILEELSQFRKQVAYYAEKDSVRLAILMAKQVLQQELKISKKGIWNILAKTLATLRGQGNFKIWLNPDDYQFAQAALPALERFADEDQTLSFRARPDIPAGNAQIETDREVIDLTFKTQFRHLERALNRTLAERETVVLNRPDEPLSPSATPQATADPTPTDHSPTDHSPATDEHTEPQAD